MRGRRLLVLVGLVGLFYGALCVGPMREGWADETVPTALLELAVLNDPVQTVDLAKEIINKINPSYETVWDVYNGGFSQGISGNLYTFTSHQVPIISVRLGASTGMALYSGLSLDLPGLSKILPASLRGAISPEPLDTLWSFVGKYARVGIVGGYSWDESDPLIGITAGAALTF